MRIADWRRAFIDAQRLVTSAIPHLGHFPGAFCTTSGCIVQVYMVIAGCVVAAWPDIPIDWWSCFDMSIEPFPESCLQPGAMNARSPRESATAASEKLDDLFMSKLLLG